MTDITDDVRPVADLWDTLRSQGVRADNRDTLRRQLAELRAVIARLSEAHDQTRLARRESEEVLDAVREQLHFAREVRDLLDESIAATQTFVSMRLDQDVVASGQIDEQPDEALRARPVKGTIDYAELSREHIARYPKIRARLAE